MEYKKLQMTKDEYIKYVMSKNYSKSNFFKDIIIAFVIGGLICMLGQFIFNTALYFNLDKDTASTISSVILILLAAFLTSIKVYSKLGNIAGAGSIVPITGFSNSIVSPAIEYKSEGYVLGIGANMFKVAGPVLVYGIGSSVIVGIIYYLLTLWR